MSSTAPSVVGARTEMAVASALQAAGMEVFVPLFAAHSRVDLVAQTEIGLLRVQCKTGRMTRPGTLYFRTHSTTGNVLKDYRGEADAFGVFAPATGYVYLVPAEGLPLRGCTLRLDPVRNGQGAGVRWASDYLVGRP